MQNTSQTARTANFGELFVTKIVKILAIRSQILRLECTKLNSAVALPQTPLGKLTALHQAL